MCKTKPNYQILVNGEHRLPRDFEDTVEIISVENAVAEPYQVEKKTYEAFLRLREDFIRHHGVQPELISAYRTVATQESVFQNYVQRFGMDYAKKYAAMPGHSEHHTGLAIDVGFLVDGKVAHDIATLLSLEHLFTELHKLLPRYGFLLRYPQGKEAVTGIGYEPWHLRYIDDPEIAEEIACKGLCFEEYKKSEELL